MDHRSEFVSAVTQLENSVTYDLFEKIRNFLNFRGKYLHKIVEFHFANVFQQIQMMHNCMESNRKFFFTRKYISS